MVSVLIATINDVHLKRTVEEVRKNADGPIEFIIVNDGGYKIKEIDNVKIINHSTTLGRRVSFNEAARVAKGDYFLILDGHCSMSQGWDTKMIESCVDNNLVYAIIRDMNPDTWEYLPGHYIHVRLNKEYTEKWWYRKALEQCEVEEESMTITGCAWMVTKKCYWDLNGYDESLGGYGWDGPEWTCKVWMGENPGSVICRTDVICGHVFGTNSGNVLYPANMIPKAKYISYMQELYSHKIDKLVERFAPVPDWEPGLKGIDVGQTTKREVKINRIDEHVTKNDKGVIIKKVKEYFEYIFTDDGTGPSEEEITKKYAEKVKKVSEEVWELKKGKLQKIA